MTGQLTHERVSSDEGVTLVELMVVMVIAAVIGGIVTTGILTGSRTVRAGEKRLDAITELQTASERVARELRAARAEPTPLLAAEDTLARTEVDRNGTRLQIEFEVDGDELVERRWDLSVDPNATGPPSTFVLVTDSGNDAGTPAFVYLDRDGNPTSTLRDIHSVRIELVRELGDGRSVQVNTAVRIRNDAGGIL